MSLKARIEAALFLTDKPMPALAIAQLVNADVQIVRQTILELIHEYEARNCALEIADDNGYMMQVKDEFATIANDIAPIDLPVSVVRTLSAIAIKQPVLQSEIVRIRGAGAYDHVKELLEKELISKKEEGRSSLLTTTKKFQEYFRLSKDAKDLRYQLKEQVDKDKPGEEGIVLGEDGVLSGVGETVAALEDAALAANVPAIQTEGMPPDSELIGAVDDHIQVEQKEETVSTGEDVFLDESEETVIASRNVSSPQNVQDSAGDQDDSVGPQINALASSNI